MLLEAGAKVGGHLPWPRTVPEWIASLAPLQRNSSLQLQSPVQWIEDARTPSHSVPAPREARD